MPVTEEQIQAMDKRLKRVDIYNLHGKAVYRSVLYPFLSVVFKDVAPSPSKAVCYQITAETALENNFYIDDGLADETFQAWAKKQKADALTMYKGNFSKLVSMLRSFFPEAVHFVPVREVEKLKAQKDEAEALERARIQREIKAAEEDRLLQERLTHNAMGGTAMMMQSLSGGDKRRTVSMDSDSTAASNVTDNAAQSAVASGCGAGTGAGVGQQPSATTATPRMS
jgi:hypothetical protein